MHESHQFTMIFDKSALDHSESTDAVEIDENNIYASLRAYNIVIVSRWNENVSKRYV